MSIPCFIMTCKESLSWNRIFQKLIHMFMNYALNFQLWRKHSGECGSHEWWKDHSCVWGATEGTGSMVKGQLRGHLRQSSLDIPKRHRDPKCLVRSGNVHWCMKENYFIVTQRILLERVVFSNAWKLKKCLPHSMHIQTFVCWMAYINELNFSISFSYTVYSSEQALRKFDWY